MKKTLLLFGFVFAMMAGAFAASPDVNLSDNIQAADATSTFFFAPMPANVPKIKNIRVRDTDSSGSTSYKIVVIVKHDDLDEVARVEVALTPASPSSPAANPAVLTLNYEATGSAKNKKRYVNRDITFAANALNKDYDATITMKRADGTTIGAVETIKVTVDDKADMDTDPAVITGVRIGETGSGSNNVYVFIDDGANLVSTVRVEIFKISRTSPDPVPSILTCAFDVNLAGITRRFANYGGLSFASSAMGEEYFVTITLLDANGVELQTPITLATIVQPD